MSIAKMRILRWMYGKIRKKHRIIMSALGTTSVGDKINELISDCLDIMSNTGVNGANEKMLFNASF